MKEISELIIAVAILFAVVVCAGTAFTTDNRVVKLAARIEQIHEHTCRLEAKLDYPTTPDCPPPHEDDK